MSTERMKPFDVPKSLASLLGAGLANEPTGAVESALDKTRSNLEARRVEAGAEPDAELAEIIAATMAIWSVDASAADRWEEARRRDQRREALRCVDGAITDADIERIVWGRVDTYAAKVVRAFLLAAKAPVSGDKPPTRFCWLAGPKGLGKTVAACMAIAEERGRYITAEQMRRAYGQETREAHELRLYIAHCHLLVVDDLGTEKNAAELDDSRAALYQLVNARQGKGRLTILTGNLAEKDIRRIYVDDHRHPEKGSRTLARIEHQGKIVTVKGPNLRRGQQALEGVQ